MDNILIPLSLWDTTAIVLSQGARMARAFGSKVWLLHIVKEPGLVAHSKWPQELQAQYDAELAEVHRQLEERADALRIQGLEVSTVVKESNATADIILQQARSLEADLIVMGSHGRGVLMGTLLGDVALEVQRQALCPILVVPMAMHKVLPEEAAGEGSAMSDE